MKNLRSSLLAATFVFCSANAFAQADFCANAVEIVPTLTNCNPIPGSSSGATQTYASCSGGGNADDDVWYFFVANSTTMSIDVDPTVGYDAVIQLFSACGSGNGLVCEDINGNNGDETLTYSGFTVGLTYLFRVYHYGVGSGTSTFTVCVTGLAPTTNNTPCAAYALPTVTPACQFQTYTNLGSAGSAVPAPSGCGGTSPFQGGYAGGDVWFSVVVPASGTLDIHTLAQDFSDGAMALYSGACGAPVLVACDDDSGPGLMPYIYQTGLPVGATYYIRMWEYGNNANGQFGICVSTPDNDDCANALEICDLNGYGGITSAAYLIDRPDNMAGTGEIPPGPFGTGYTGPSPVTIDNNHWLKFTANSTTAELFVDIHACALNLGMQMQIFESNNCTNFIPVSNFLETTNSQVVLATGLTVGLTYYIMVDGFAGDVCSYTITATSGVAVVEVSATPAQLCLGDSTTLLANVTGTGSYTYSWSSVPAGGPYPAGSTFDAAPTVNTEYTVQITGLCGSAVNSSVVVSVFDNPTTSITPNPAEFCEGQTLSMNPTLAGGSGIYTGGAWTSDLTMTNTTNTSVDLSGNTAGNYFVTYTLTDNNGCEAKDSIDVTVNPLPNATITAVAPMCNDAAAVTLIPSTPGGTFSGPGVTGTTFDPQSVAPGNHTITYNITDGNNCSNSSTIVITVHPLPDGTISAVAPMCVDASSISLTVGTPGGTFGGPGVTGSTFDPAAAGPGTHTITYNITDPNGCSASDTETITVNALPDATITPAGPVCNDAAAIPLSAATSGGSFSGSGVTGSSFDPTSVIPGTYTITYNITDVNGCSNSATTDIVVNPAPDATISAIGPFCDGDAAVSLTVGTSGGTFGGPGVSGSTFDPAVAGSGTHTITYSITNASGCSDSDSETVTVNALPNANITPAGPVCNDAAIVPLSAATSGGTFSGTGVTGSSFDPSSVTPGTYTITYDITDGNNCSNSATTDIIVNAVPDATITPIGPFCTGDAAVPLTAGTAGGTFSGTGVSGTTFDPAPLAPGTYTINYTITDGNGCSDADSYDVLISSALDATIGPAGPFCTDDAAIALTAGNTGGTWSGPGITDPNNGIFDPSLAGVGSYEVMYSIPGSCGDQDTAIIVVNQSFDATITGVGPFCTADAGVTLIATDNGGTWTGTGITNTTTGAFDPATAGPGTHTITYAIAGACGDTQTTDVVVNQTPADPIVSSDTTCNGSDLLLFATGSGGTLNWYSDPNTTNLVAADTNQFAPVTTGTWYVTETSNGCASGIASGSAVSHNVSASFVALPDSGSAPLDVDFINTSTGVTSTDSFYWDFGDGGFSSDFEPSHTYNSEGTFVVTLTIITADGACTDQYTWEIFVDDPFLVEIPNVFTPNGDGQNDVFNVVVKGVEEMRVIIHNRWGQHLWTSVGTTASWDGRTTAGLLVPDGTYFYIIEVVDIKGEDHLYKGAFTVLY